MTYPKWEQNQNTMVTMTERQTIERLLIMVDAQKRAISRNGNGLTAMEGEEISWKKWELCGQWLREKLRGLEARRSA